MNLALVYFLWMMLAGCQQLNKQENDQSVSQTISAAIKEHRDTLIKTTSASVTIQIAAVGDIMLGTNFPDESYLPADVHALLKPADSLLVSPHITFGNAEGVFLDEGGISKGSGPNMYNFRQPLSYAKVLKEAGFDFISIANNHIYDFGSDGMESSIRTLENNGLKIAGTPSRPYTIIEKEGLKIGMVAFAPHSGCLQLNDLPAVISLVKETKAKCDILLVSFHGGAEGEKATHVPRQNEFFYEQNRGDVYTFSHQVIDAGADIVIGHGPHVPRAIELYKSRLIAYSLGNFCTYARFNLKGINSYAPLIMLTINKEGLFMGGEIYSFLQLGEGGPVPDPNHAAARLIKELSSADFPESKLIIDDEGMIHINKNK